MKKEYLLNLDSITDLTNFVKEISENIYSDVDASYERQVVDAKSYLGLVAISIHPVIVKINSDNEKEIQKFSTICEKFQFEKGE